MQVYKPSELVAHPQNEYFFDNMEGQKWQEFLESIRTSGVIEPPIVTGNKVIVSGHQRVRACLELGIKEIICENRVYDNPDRVTKDLIETNIRQRGTIAGSELKMGRIIKELERIYGVKNGVRSDRKLPQVAEGKSQSEIANELGMSVDKMNRLKKLAELPDEYQDMIESGTISVNTAASLISKLSEDEQNLLLKELPSAQKFTQAQVQTYIDQIKGLEKEKEDLQKEAVDAVRLADGAAKANEDSAEYLRMKEEKDKANEERRKYYEEADQLKKKLAELDAKHEDEIKKVKEDYRKLVAAKEDKIEELESAEPETVEVVPDDYEEIKADRERLLKELEVATHQSDMSRQFKRRGAEERSDEDKRIGFEQRIVNETGDFLSNLRCLEVEIGYCSEITPVSKSLVRRNVEMIQQILIKIDAAIIGGETECKSA